MNITCKSQAMMLAVLIPALCLAAQSAQQTAPPPSNESVTLTGEVAAWSIHASGTVALRLEGVDAEGEPFDLWFETAANRTSSTNFEDLVLQALQASPGATVTVTGEAAGTDRGVAPAAALTLTSIRRAR